MSIITFFREAGLGQNKLAIGNKFIIFVGMKRIVLLLIMTVLVVRMDGGAWGAGLVVRIGQTGYDEGVGAVEGVNAGVGADERAAAGGSRRVRGAMGEVPMVGMTPEQARISALEAAKTEALRMASIEQEIKSTQAVHVTSTEQLLSSFSTIEMRGAVVDYQVVKEDFVKQPGGLIYYRVVINATIQRYRTVPDAEFVFDVQGLSEAGYRQGQRIDFRVVPGGGGGYLHIFMVDPLRVVDRVFPSDLEPGRLFAADSVVRFPTTPSVIYTACKATQDKMESNFLVMVMTKKDVKFKQELTLDNLGGWINSMEPDQRVVRVENILITK